MAINGLTQSVRVVYSLVVVGLALATHAVSLVVLLVFAGGTLKTKVPGWVAYTPLFQAPVWVIVLGGALALLMPTGSKWPLWRWVPLVALASNVITFISVSALA